MYTKILKMIGQRSPCCGAKMATWAPKKLYCTSCEKWIRTDKAAADMKAIKPRARLARLKTKQ